MWGDGSALRSYTYIEDLIDGIRVLMGSDVEEPTNIAGTEYVTVDELVQTVTGVAGKALRLDHVDGPVGVRARKCSNRRMLALGWRPRYTLAEGMGVTFPWVEEQVHRAVGRDERYPSASSRA